ncbi:hypothetical protein D3C80_1227360 [compost metagenome]
MLIGDGQGSRSLHLHQGIEGRRQHRHRRLQTEAATGNHADVHAQVIADRQGCSRVVAVMAGPLFLVFGRRQPDLQAMQA